MSATGARAHYPSKATSEADPPSSGIQDLSISGSGKAVRRREDRSSESIPEEPSERPEFRSETISYDAQRLVGSGSFGAVFQARVVETNEVVAIKKVLQDKRFKNRELSTMKMLAKKKHPYIVFLKHYFISKGSSGDDVYLNLVLDFVPETVYSVTKRYRRSKESVPIDMVRIYMYQLCRALAHIHGMGICHRDVKPQNLLVDPARCVLKLCDFGSAKCLEPGEPNVAYICSRYYRAPELIFGALHYTTLIDVWSQGCVFAEMLLGTPIFPGSSGIDQLVEIIKILGTPTLPELMAMNPNYKEFKFPTIRSVPWTSVFPPNTDVNALNLIAAMLIYIPGNRCKAIEACGHAFFDELRSPTAKLPSGAPMPQEMLQFTPDETVSAPHSLLQTLIPPHVASLNQDILNNASPSASDVSTISQTVVNAAVHAANLGAATLGNDSPDASAISTSSTAGTANNTTTTGAGNRMDDSASALTIDAGSMSMIDPAPTLESTTATSTAAAINVAGATGANNNTQASASTSAVETNSA